MKNVRSKQNSGIRIRLLRAGIFGVALIIATRLFLLQVVDGNFYQALASGQHSIYKELFADRGNIWVRDWVDGSEYKVATNVPSHFVYAEPVRIEDPFLVTTELSFIFGYPVPTKSELEVINGNTGVSVIEEEEVQEISSDDWISEVDLTSEEIKVDEGVIEEAILIDDNLSLDQKSVQVEESRKRYVDFLTLLARLSKENDPYEPVRRNVTDAMLDKIKEFNFSGIRWITESARAYPENGIGGHVLGFVGRDDNGKAVGRYGIEGAFEQFLAGQDGYLQSVSDPSGRWIKTGSRAFQPAVNGGDILLTIDRTIQFIACEAIKRGVERYQADMGTVVVLEPKTGRVIAMCSWPDFNPATYSNVSDIAVYNNPAIAHSYEPGSIFKSLIMAAGIDANVITPNTFYTDTGEVKIDRFTIRNSNQKANGWQNMTFVLDNSLNTGMIFVMRQLGMSAFKNYMDLFNFGKRTGIELPGEASGNFNSLNNRSEIFYATASFGQGVTTTPLQMAQAYAAIANDGLLMKPYIVEEKRYDGGFVDRTVPQPLHQVISSRAAKSAAGMMVSVVEGSHGRNARVDGYYVAGKTGTAQVASASGGYATGHTKASFAGFAPVSDPKFAMVVMLDKPRTSPWADSTSAVIWGEIAQFMLRYFEVIPER
jgi:stage V sporulation protein D (sporulation-specific penicillin-binding protein)